MDYEQLLKRGRAQLPESVFVRDRFEIPKPIGHIQGNKTIIKNFGKIAQALDRPAEHLLKYLLKELATPGTYKNNILTIGAKASANNIYNKIKQYAEIFVLCSECGKPETKIIKEGGFSQLRCMACGHKRAVRSII